jgi:hypothetical protein
MSEGVGERLRTVRNHDQVHVIRHQTVAQQRKPVKIRILSQEREISGAFLVTVENHLSRIAPLRNMVRDVRHDHAR